MSSEYYSDNFFSRNTAHPLKKKTIYNGIRSPSPKVKNFSELNFDEQYCHLKSAYPNSKLSENSLFQLRSELDEIQNMF